MSEKTKTIADLVATAGRARDAVDALASVSAVILSTPDASAALNRKLAETENNVLAPSIAQRLGLAAAVIREYQDVLDELTRTTTIAWPPTTAVVESQVR